MIYLDASAAVSQFVVDANTAEARAFIRRPGLSFGVSDLCVAEFTAAIAQHVRAQRYNADVARALISAFETWSAASADPLALLPTDVSATISVLRRFDIRLRTPDALHLTICQRVGAQLLSFDKDQIAAALELGIPLAQ
ncbi:type II toxin-antitoxin system VapC family toxin [Glacieibacterium frigidum]|uniref:Type II toxin-antitoxin system VapC family toxin n=1 Tax=Glacieibacterium frigidum TaxID=2593303 RepID=A0A552U9I3_9SPHN|nr:type II toxin-antitoxin system VapC family toxin [Glacieibacterium frigidum]TRW14865.1 type II toxin-antitoxin system VapC family toxin [Glacieibacterium frigidum]